MPVYPHPECQTYDENVRAYKWRSASLFLIGLVLLAGAGWVFITFPDGQLAKVLAVLGSLPLILSGYMVIIILGGEHKTHYAFHTASTILCTRMSRHLHNRYHGLDG